ncbi:hypothetical protein [Maritimibacter sp. DP1N21-5]|uniref:hypothetical protein n=1 Tax=Maritimibacter sp. DP1N21-5 TaxID=2836867 RepID=UPI001C4631C7|nr:hypothetical protein [Maritimibacter sp. DP1N21-5]MBV7411125.1 hypothetical protein [Maritimibacter sp. DP1N21-5]
MDLTQSAGHAVVQFILAIANHLTKSESAPGLVALGIGVAMVIVAVLFLVKHRSRMRSIKTMRREVAAYESVQAFADGFEEFKARVFEQKSASYSAEKLWEAWDEYAETIVADDVERDTPVVLRNSIRPSSFLYVDDLGYGPGWFRILPNIFVSFGLFFTFLGLVAALGQFAGQMDGSSPDTGMDAAMGAFMAIASAKFIMSLSGLAASILFTILLRVGAGRIDRELHALCLLIERRLKFVSLEDLGFRQLKAAERQKDHLQEIGFAMVEKLQEPLNALPDHISATITKEINPIFEKVSSMGSSNMEGLVGNLSDQLSHSVGSALTQASTSLGEASDRMNTMLDKMGATNAQSGETLNAALRDLVASMADLKANVSDTGAAASNAMNEGAERMLSVMNDTLSGIRDNTSEGASAMSRAAEEMRKAAESFRDQVSEAAAEGAAAVQARMAETSAQAGTAIEGAGSTLMQSFDRASQEIARLGEQLGENIGRDIIGKLDQIGERLSDASGAIADGAGRARTAATSFEQTATTINTATGSFDIASKALVSAAGPLRASQDAIEVNIRKLTEATDATSTTVMTSAKMVAEGAKGVLEAAQTALGNEREGIRASLEATRAALSKLSEEAENLDKIDELIGRALVDYNRQLEAALGTAQDHVSDMAGQLQPGLDTLRQVVEQAENFMPTQARRS